MFSNQKWLPARTVMTLAAPYRLNTGKVGIGSRPEREQGKRGEARDDVVLSRHVLPPRWVETEGTSAGTNSRGLTWSGVDNGWVDGFCIVEVRGKVIDYDPADLGSVCITERNVFVEEVHRVRWFERLGFAKVVQRYLEKAESVPHRFGRISISSAGTPRIDVCPQAGPRDFLTYRRHEV